MKSKKGFSIPIIIPIIVIIGIVLLACYEGKELITNAAQYTKANTTTTDASKFKYTQLENGTLEITGYTGSDVDIVIPEVVDGKVITSIGENAFTGKWNIKSVQIPQTVIKIGKKAFYNCKKLEEINIPKNITIIEESILESTAITSIQIPSGVTSIGANAFSGTNLTKVKLPDSVITIGANAFQSCYYLQKINIPKGVTVIESATFQSCAFESIELPEGITSIGESAFVLCEELKSIDIPETVTTIGPNAFKWCDGLTSVVIPNGVTMIDSSAFSECDNLSKLVIPDSVTEFGSGMYKKGTIYCRSNSKAEEYAKTNNITYVIDDKEPEVKSIVGNPTKWTTFDVKITVNAEEPENESGLWRKAYSFDGGKTWQKENNKTYTENTNGIIIKVKDNLTNTYTSEEIKITRIDKEFPTIFDVTKSTEEPTKGSVTVTIDADDAISGLADLPYSFNGGTTWQAENSKTYTGNVSGLEIKVKDEAGNVTTYDEEISITNIIEVESIKITSLPLKTEYNAYEDLDTTGLVVTATYSDGSEEEITDYKINGDKNLSCKQTKIVIQYNGDYSLKDEFAISVAHAYEEIITAPTCTAQGYTTKKCEICFDSSVFDYVDALGHSFTNYETDHNATCTEDGTKTATCDRCIVTDTITDGGSALGHNYKKTVINPTCKQRGYTVFECIVCNSKYEDEFVEALGHSFTNYILNDDATCTEDATKTATCDRCTATDTQKEEGTAVGHTEVIDAKVEPTCLEKGLTEGKHCSVCEEVLVKQEEIDALGHNYENLKCTNCEEEAPRITITTENFEISEDYITKIPTGTSAQDLKEQIQITNATEIKLLNKKGEELTDDDIIATGTTLILKSEFETKTLKLVVAGDATGDGVADFKDIVAINRHRLNKKLLEGEYLLAAEVTGDGKADFKDIVKINRFRLNKITQLISSLVK